MSGNSGGDWIVELIMLPVTALVDLLDALFEVLKR